MERQSDKIAIYTLEVAYSRQKYRLFKVRHSRLPAASKANENVAGGEREEGASEGERGE